MKKLTFITAFTLLAAAAMAQAGLNISGTVTNDGVPVPNAYVYFMNVDGQIVTADTLETAITDINGVFDAMIETDADSLQLLATTTACQEIYYFFWVNNLGATVSVECEDWLPEPYEETLFMAAISVNAEEDEWLFMSSVIGEPVSYDWSIDGNSFDTPNVTYLFPESGTYTASLTVEMITGNTLTDELVINVAGAPNCQAVFFPIIDSLNTEALVFVNASIGNDLSYSWDFGDGTTSTEAYPTHQFADSADYEVCLTITGEDCSDTFCLTLSTALVAGWSEIVFGGRGSSEGADENGFVFTVVAPSAQSLSSRNTVFDMELKLYPNPTSGDAFVKFYSETTEAAQVRVVDMTGKTVLQENVNIATGANTINLNLNRLNEGIYLMYFESNSKQRGVTKVMVR